MNSPKLSNIKKELSTLPQEELVNIGLRLAKYKTENKELLNYLLFYGEDKNAYVDEVKSFLNENFEMIPYTDYAATKVLRKVTRLMNKHIKFISEKQQEVEIAIYFCELFMAKSITRTSHKPLIALLYRQLKRIDKLLPKLDEDLQFDFQNEFDLLLDTLKTKRPSFSLYDLK